MSPWNDFPWRRCPEARGAIAIDRRDPQNNEVVRMDLV
jgi:hypothetical protein